MMRRFLIGTLLGSLIFIGCGNPGPKSQTIVIWHWMTDRHKAFQELSKKYEQETGTKVIFELYAPSDVYSQKVVAAAQARILPDIFGILDEKVVVSSFIEGGFVVDLTPEFMANNGEWERSFFPEALAVNRFSEGNVYKIKPGIYGVPIDVTNIQMVYNIALLKKAGITRPPQNFKEFLDDAKALKAVGVPALVSGWGELWMIDCFASNYAFNIMGEEKVMATFRGEVPYTDPDWIAVLNIFKTLHDNDALIEGVVTKANKYAEQDFALGRVAFAFNGSWCVNVYKDMNPNLNYGTMLPPPITEAHPMKVWGGAGSSFVVNNLSTNKDKAIAFLKWFTAKDQQAYLAEVTKNLPSNKDALSAIPQILSDFATSMGSTTHPKVWPYNEDPLVIEAFDRGLQSIMIGEASPEQVAQDVQKAKERQMEKAKRRQEK